MWTENIVFKHNTCTINGKQKYYIPDNMINLYVVVNRKCNAGCEFCEFTDSKTSSVDLENLEKIISDIYKIGMINKLHITGGEPGLDVQKVKEITKICKDKDKLIGTSVNSNGTNLEKLLTIETLDNIALSRHHYNEDKNKELMKIQTVSNNDIMRLDDELKKKIHLSCNLIKEYIDSPDEIRKYLEFASKLNINDVGLVGLMQINDFCRACFVDFNTLDLSKIDNLIKSKQSCNYSKDKELTCKCENYLYRAENLRLISMYHRYAIKNSEIADYLVYENNSIKQGFSGKVINY